MKKLLPLLMTLILTACSGLKPYPDQPNKNFSVKTVTDSGSVFKDVAASLDIYSVNADCTTLYKGTVQLDKPIVELGLPPKQQSYLVFVFNTSGFLSASSGSISSNTLITPKTGYRYMAEVSYAEDIYNVVIYEMNPGGKQSKELELKGLDNCGMHKVSDLGLKNR